MLTANNNLNNNNLNNLNNNNNNNYWNLVSLSIIALILYPFLSLFINNVFFYNVFFLTGLLSTDLITKFIKLYLNKNDILKRPEGACDCDILCKNGDQSNKPGMPSGHVAIASFFFTFLYMTNKSLQNNVFISFSIMYVSLIGLSRYYKKCHNEVQVLVGALLGSTVAIFYSFILYKLNESN